jgi:hypothetical protein
MKYWFKGGFAQFAARFIVNRRGVDKGYLDGAFVDRLLNDTSMQKRSSKAMWAIMIFEMWLQKEEQQR